MRHLIVLIAIIAVLAVLAWQMKKPPQACDDNFLNTTSVHYCALVGGTK
jgi:hypothetical protein